MTIGSRRVLHGYLALLLGVVFGKVIALGSEVRLARALGPGLLGQYGTLLAVLSYGLTVANMGLDTVGTRAVARDRTTAGAYQARIRNRRLGIGILVVVAAVVSAILLRVSIGPIAPLLVVPLALAFRDDWLLIALGRDREVATASVFHDVIFFLLVFWLVKSQAGVLRGAVCFACSELAWAGWIQWRLRRTRFAPQNGQEVPRINGLFLMGLPIAVMGVLSLSTGRVSTALTSAIGGVTAAGAFYATQRILLAIQAVVAPFGRVILPALSAETRPSEGLTLGAGIARIGFYLSLTGSLFGLVLYHFSLPIVKLLYGSQFAAAGPVLRWTAISAFASTAYLVPSQYLLSQHRERALAGVTLLAACVNITLCLTTVGKMGAEGAALACAAADAVILFGALALLYKTVVLRRSLAATAFISAAASMAVVIARALIPTSRAWQFTLSLGILCASTWVLPLVGIVAPVGSIRSGPGEGA